jgi:TetR/AcrR family transcriptional repressor of bet genes
VLDGLFQQALLGHVTGDETALPTLVEEVHSLMPMMLAPASGNPVDAVR